MLRSATVLKLSTQRHISSHWSRLTSLHIDRFLELVSTCRGYFYNYSRQMESFKNLSSLITAFNRQRMLQAGNVCWDTPQNLLRYATVKTRNRKGFRQFFAVKTFETKPLNKEKLSHNNSYPQLKSPVIEPVIKTWCQVQSLLRC